MYVHTARTRRNNAFSHDPDTVQPLGVSDVNSVVGVGLCSSSGTVLRTGLTLRSITAVVTMMMWGLTSSGVGPTGWNDSKSRSVLIVYGYKRRVYSFTVNRSESRSIFIVYGSE